MACKTSYELHHHFPKLAEESGFTFNTHRPRIHIDWNKIRLIDLDSLIRERKFFIIEQHLNDILDCVLESEFDVRILDEGVMKMFRLAQLAVEYQQFCRHYLDRSVYVLREEITALAQELDATKKDLRERDEEIRKLRKKTKYTYRTPLPYGNENIATMILKSLTNKSDIFPSTSNGDTLQYNKCSYCDKIFLNQLYLKSHISRRHSNVNETPQKDDSQDVQNVSTVKENSKLNDEIMELKIKLKEMETLITKTHSQNVVSVASEVKNESPSDRVNNLAKKTKDAEVSTNNDNYLLDKIEEWKKEEHEKYNKELNLLRIQIIETINSFKEREVQKPVQSEELFIEQLNKTIKQQGAEIIALQQELKSSKLKAESEEGARRKEADAQMLTWSKRAEAQSKQYESLLQKLDDVAKEARESRAMAEAERERATQLQALLQQSLIKKSPENTKSTNSITNFNPKYKSDETIPLDENEKSYHQTTPRADNKTLEKLHLKAKELLSIRSTSSSESSSASVDKARPLGKPTASENVQDKLKKINNSAKKAMQQNSTKSNQRKQQNDKKIAKIKESKLKKKSKSHSNIVVENGPILAPGSPIKVVRAKITEEVNSRLVAAGVDPLKSRLPQSVFQKQRMQLQQRHELKSKRNPSHREVRNSILAYLDTTISGTRKEVTGSQDYFSPSKISKAFSLTSVLSNVKSKALSLVKSNDTNGKAKRKDLDAEVAKKVLSFLKSPSGTASSSPVTQARPLEKKSKTDSPAWESKSIHSKVKTRHNSEIPSADKGKNSTLHYSDDNEDESDHKYYNSAIIHQSAKSIDSLIKSPARRPSSATADYTGPVRKDTINESELNLVRSRSAVNVSELKQETNTRDNPPLYSNENSSDDVESLIDIPFIKNSANKENIQKNPKQTKGVLKNASSTSSLNKKKVLFDMDAIQMKSVSGSLSQSVTDKSDATEKFELGLVNLDGEEWDISSIENEPLKNDTKIQFNSRTSPKIAELKQTIESQLARRSETRPSALVGGVDVLAGAGAAGPMVRGASLAGSNTSLGSSILDDSESTPAANRNTRVKPKRITEKDDSEIDISEYSIDGIVNKKTNESF